jgi:hypothetical protein
MSNGEHDDRPVALDDDETGIKDTVRGLQDDVGRRRRRPAQPNEHGMSSRAHAMENVLQEIEDGACERLD